jgi:hypothetical protein
MMVNPNLMLGTELNGFLDMALDLPPVWHLPGVFRPLWSYGASLHWVYPDEIARHTIPFSQDEVGPSAGGHSPSESDTPHTVTID